MIIVFSSCTGELVSYEFESYNWKKNTLVDLNFNSEDEGIHDLVLDVRSIYGLNHPNLILDFNLTKPDGRTLSFSKELSFDTDKLDCSGDFCDQSLTILTNLHLVKGSYLLNVKPVNSVKDLYGFMEFRLIQK